MKEKNEELRNELFKTIALYVTACDEKEFEENLLTLSAALVRFDFMNLASKSGYLVFLNNNITAGIVPNLQKKT